MLKNFRKALIPLLALTAIIVVLKPALAAISFSGNPSGSCYRNPTWFANGGCTFPGSNQSYSNLRSVTWGQAIGNTPATVEFLDGNNVNRVFGTCALGRTLNYAGNFTCYNPYPYSNIILKVTPIQNYTRTNFYISPS